MTNKNIDIFLSYNSADEEATQKIVKRLKSYGTSVWFAKWDIKPGDDIVSKINEGLQKANFYGLIMSPESIRAEWPSAERSAAIYNDPSGRLGRVIPIIVKPCSLPPLLSFRNHIRLHNKDMYEHEFQKLICSIRGLPLSNDNKDTNPDTARLTSNTDTTLPNVNESHKPDEIAETLYSNLFPVKDLPKAIWGAPTAYSIKRRVYDFYRSKAEPPPFILKEYHLYTFVDLSKADNPFSEIIKDSGKISFTVQSWIEDENKARWLVELLNSTMKNFCLGIGLKLDFDTKQNQKHYPPKDFRIQKARWRSHSNLSTRNLIIPRNKNGKVAYYRHRAVNLRFVMLGNEIFLRINPGWFFTYDGERPIVGKKRGPLSTRIKSRQHNLQEFDEMRFWAWFMSNDGKTLEIKLGGGTLGITTKPWSIETNFGVFGDVKKLPEEVPIPPSFEDDQELTPEELKLIDEDMEDEDAEDEDDGI